MKEYFKGIRRKIEDVTRKSKIVMKVDFKDLIKKLKLDKK